MKGKWKQNSKKKTGNAVLQKYKVAVDEFIKSKGESKEEESERSVRFVKKKSRKELRKEKRKMKKAKMKSHYEGKKFLDLPTGDEKNIVAPAEKIQKKGKDKAKKEVSSKAQSSKSSSKAPANKSDNTKSSSAKKGKKINRLQESRKMALLEANEDEDREIKKLERCLGLNKRKNKKSLPQSFVADGLDYILGVLDSGSSAVGVYDDDDDMDMAKENFEKLGENEPQLSDVDETSEDEMASEGSDEDENEPDEEEVEESDNEDDEMVEEEEEMEDEMDESDAVDSEDGSEVEADTTEINTSDSKTENVS